MGKFQDITLTGLERQTRKSIFAARMGALLHISAAYTVVLCLAVCLSVCHVRVLRPNG